MAASRSGFPSELCAGVEQDFVCSSRLQSTQYRLDAPAFLSQTQLSSFIPSSASSTKLSGLAGYYHYLRAVRRDLPGMAVHCSV